MSTMAPTAAMRTTAMSTLPIAALIAPMTNTVRLVRLDQMRTIGQIPLAPAAQLQSTPRPCRLTQRHLRIQLLRVQRPNTMSMRAHALRPNMRSVTKSRAQQSTGRSPLTNSTRSC